MRKLTKYPGGRRVNSRCTRVLRKIPGILPIWPKIWLILGPNQPQTRLRAQNLTISTEFSREKREEKRGCCREKRKGKQTGCERQTLFVEPNERAKRCTWSTWSAVSSLTSRAGELRSAPSGPDDRDRVAGKRALALGGARSQGHNTGLRGLAPRTGFPLNCRTRPLLGASGHDTSY